MFDHGKHHWQLFILDAIQKAREFLEAQISVNDDLTGFMA